MAPGSDSDRISYLASNFPAPGRGPPRSNSQVASPSGVTKKRTSHACDRCRLMRTKCSGGTRCIRCTKDDAVCVYGDHKRERNKKDLVESATRIRELEGENRSLTSTLRQLSSLSESRPLEHSDVVSMLSKFPQEDQGESSQESRSQSRSIQSATMDVDSKSDKGGEGVAPSAIGSPGSQGELLKVVDLDHGAGAAGFIGKMSEISWIQRCREYLVHQPAPTVTDIDQPEVNTHATAAVGLAYYMDDQSLLAVDEDHVDPLQWPVSQMVTITTEAYFHATQGIFQFLLREPFLEAIYDFPRQQFLLSWAQRRWLAVANMVWAIGSKWLHLAKLDDAEFFENHVVYYARARALGLDHRVSFDHPDVEMVQGLGLLSLYLLINGSISRAWNSVGNAVRHAMSLGLHLKVSDPSISEVEQSRRAQTWFSLYKLQMLIAETTGRPHLVRTAHVTIPLETLERYSPGRAVDRGDHRDRKTLADSKKTWVKFLSLNCGAALDMSSSDFVTTEFPRLEVPVPKELFLYHVRLCQLSEEITDQLYTGRQEIPWSQTQWRVEELQRGLDAWMGTLPDGLKLNGVLQGNQNSRANIHLAMYACSVAMMLHRPCLCEIHIDKESQRSKDFNLSSARACVNAAISMLGLIPDNFVACKIYQLLPWWTLLHYICQAAAVLLLELCLDAQHFQGETGRIMSALWKAMSHLSCMTEDSMSAYRAWRIFHKLFQKVSSRYGEPSTFDFSQEAVRPLQWSGVEEKALLTALE